MSKSGNLSEVEDFGFCASGGVWIISEFCGSLSPVGFVEYDELIEFINILEIDGKSWME